MNKIISIIALLVAGLSFAFISNTTGDPTITVTATKMKVFYIGVNNPLTITSTNIDLKDLIVTAKNVNLIANGKGNYNVTANKPGAASIKIQKPSGASLVYEFRVKRIPDPIAMIGNSSTGGAMSTGEFKAQQGVRARLDNFDFDAVCKIQGYELTKISFENNKVITNEQSVNGGARYNEKSKRLIASANPGDYYTFTNVKVRCPGDMAGRRVNTLAFKIK